MLAVLISTIVMVVVIVVVMVRSGLASISLCPVHPVAFEVFFEDPPVAFFPGGDGGDEGDALRVFFQQLYRILQAWIRSS
ncbi:MAG: hypothetical protein VX496_05020, partial [Planctomycetota bacterium]|nr:hypothetical protein [Planctomycetota bacterium]